ncbi:MAG: hypothetical protein KME03_06835 [Aphanocapsa lilacina HA4352-LM1]|jgi:hypothetical protein|nr:hypothetical protein [Aphanocapsa lilacina HA4352-LM1]
MLPPLIQSCPGCRGRGFLPNPKLPEALCRQRQDWSTTTWYTAWEAMCEDYGGAALPCPFCLGSGTLLTAAGEQVAQVVRFLHSPSAPHPNL